MPEAGRSGQACCAARLHATRPLGRRPARHRHSRCPAAGPARRRAPPPVQKPDWPAAQWARSADTRSVPASVRRGGAAPPAPRQSAGSPQVRPRRTPAGRTIEAAWSAAPSVRCKHRRRPAPPPPPRAPRPCSPPALPAGRRRRAAPDRPARHTPASPPRTHRHHPCRERPGAAGAPGGETPRRSPPRTHRGPGRAARNSLAGPVSSAVGTCRAVGPGALSQYPAPATQFPTAAPGSSHPCVVRTNDSGVNVTAAAPATATRWLALVALLAGGFLPPVDFFIVNVALPSIHESLNASPAEVQLVVSGYAAGYAVFLI